MRERRRTHFFILFFKSDVTNFSFIINSRLKPYLKRLQSFVLIIKYLKFTKE